MAPPPQDWESELRRLGKIREDSRADGRESVRQQTKGNELKAVAILSWSRTVKTGDKAVGGS